MKIVQERVDPYQAPLLAALFGDGGRVSEAALRGESGVFGRRALALELVLQHLPVQANLFGEVGFEARAAEPVSQPGPGLHALSMTRAIAASWKSKSRTSRVSCLRPAGVIL